MSVKSSIRALLAAALMFAGSAAPALFVGRKPRSSRPALFVGRKPRSSRPALDTQDDRNRYFQAPQINADDVALQKAQEKRARKASKRLRQAAGATK